MEEQRTVYDKVRGYKGMDEEVGLAKIDGATTRSNPKRKVEQRMGQESVRSAIGAYDEPSVETCSGVGQCVSNGGRGERPEC